MHEVNESRNYIAASQNYFTKTLPFDAHIELIITSTISSSWENVLMLMEYLESGSLEIKFSSSGSAPFIPSATTVAFCRNAAAVTLKQK